MNEPSPDPLLDPQRLPSRAGVLRAAEKIAALLPPTPLLPLEVDGVTLWCKAESLQPVGAFKIRGAWHRLSDLHDDQRARGVLGVSSGNHAQGVAWAARRLGIDAVIVMPHDAPRTKLAATRALGAEVVLYERGRESRDEVAAAIVERTGRTLVHAFGDPWVIEGQGSAGIEAEAQVRAMTGRSFDRIIANCGGGGLSSGLSLALPDAALSIVEPEGWDDVVRSLAAGHIVAVDDPPPSTICDALQPTQTFPLNFAILSARQPEGTSVSDAEVRAAMRLAFDRLHLVIEPGGAAALAAVLAGKVTVGATMLVTLSGGNVDRDQFAAVLAQGD